MMTQFQKAAADCWTASLQAPNLDIRTGILPFEYESPQSVSIAVEVSFPAELITAPKGIKDVVDYDRIRCFLHALQDDAHEELLENIAIKIINACFADYRLWHVTVKLTKNEIYGGAAFPSVQLSLSRGAWFWKFATARPRLVAAVAAQDKTGIMGDSYDNDIPWDIPSDVATWQQRCVGKIVICGRKTAEGLLHLQSSDDLSTQSQWEELLVVTSAGIHVPAHCPVQIVPSLGHALSLCQNKEVMLIGGASIFEEAIRRNVVDILFLSRIHEDLASITRQPVRFPAIPKGQFNECDVENIHLPGDQFAYSIHTLRSNRDVASHNLPVNSVCEN